MKRLSPVERFLRSYIPEPNTGCWLWLLTITQKGYGHLNVSGRQRAAHRVSWEIFHGAIPHEMHVLHRCDTPACINPGHLFLGTNAENTADKMKKGRYRPCTANGNFTRRKKLSADDVLAICSTQESGRQLAARFGVSRRVIDGIRSGSRHARFTEAMRANKNLRNPVGWPVAKHLSRPQ